MTTTAPRDGAQEIELKLALPTSDPSTLAQRLARVPELARRKPVRRHLHNVYYDTSDQALCRQRVALRIRRVGSDAQPHWLQTLKTGGSGHSALSQRGEWELTVPSPDLLALDPLQATPWSPLPCPPGSPCSRCWVYWANCGILTSQRR